MSYAGRGSANREKLVSISGSNPIYVGNSTRNVITVDNRGNAEFSSIKAAVESITDSADSTNAYVIEIAPGYYTENPFILPTGVSLNGSPGTVIRAASDIDDFITVNSSRRVDISNLITVGPQIAGAAITCQKGSLTLTNIGIRDCFIGINIKELGVFNAGYNVNVNNITHPNAPVGTGIIIRNNGIPGITNLYASSTFINMNTAVLCLGGAVSLNNSGGRTCTNGLVVESGTIFLSGYKNSLSATGIIVRNVGRISGHGFVSDASSIVDLRQRDEGEISLSASNISLSKLDVADFSKISVLTSDDERIGDAGIAIVGGQFAVGMPEKGAESVFGQGDSYVRGMLVYTSGVGTGTLTNITSSVNSDSNGLTASFPGLASGNAIYFASDLNCQEVGDKLKHYGVKVDMSTLGVYPSGTKAFVLELSTPTGWIPCESMTTEASGGFKPSKFDAFKTYKSQHIRYNINKTNEDWGKLNILGDGTPRYWSRFRATSTLSTLPIINQIKLHTSRTEINADGYIEYFGNARPFSTIPYDLGLLEPAAASPGNQDVYLSDNLDVGRVENLLSNSATTRVSFTSFAPTDMDTSCPLEIVCAYFSTTIDTGAIDWTVRWAYHTIGETLYTSQATAPTLGLTERSITFSKAAPGVVGKTDSWRIRLDFEGMLTYRSSPSIGDLLFVSIERSGSDAHTGNIALVQLVPRYIRFTEGGHI